MCAYDFFKADNILFGTDFPYDSQLGVRLIRETIQSVVDMNISKLKKKMIFETNVRRVLRLPV